MEYQLNLSDTNRVIAVEDGDYEFGDVFGGDMSLVIICNKRNYGSYYGTDYGIAGDVQNLADRFDNPVLRERAITLYLNLLGYSAKVVELRGYSQGDWATGVLIARGECSSWLEQIASSVNAWFRGDVFTLHSQELQTYVNVKNVNDKFTKWVTIDSVGGYVIENREMFKEACVDCFDIPKGDWQVTIA